MDRRKFLKRMGVTALGSVVPGVQSRIHFLEAKWCRVTSQTIVLPNLPATFRGTRTLMADVHHGPFVPLVYIRHVVSMANALKPDITILAGDYRYMGIVPTSNRA